MRRYLKKVLISGLLLRNTSRDFGDPSRIFVLSSQKKKTEKKKCLYRPQKALNGRTQIDSQHKLLKRRIKREPSLRGSRHQIFIVNCILIFRLLLLLLLLPSFFLSSFLLSSFLLSSFLLSSFLLSSFFLLSPFFFFLVAPRWDGAHCRFSPSPRCQLRLLCLQL